MMTAMVEAMNEKTMLRLKALIESPSNFEKLFNVKVRDPVAWFVKAERIMVEYLARLNKINRDVKTLKMTLKTLGTVGR